MPLSKRNLCPVEDLRRVFAYDPLTGSLTWRVTVSSHGVAGQSAGTKMQSGYRRVRLSGKNYLAHRVIWAIVTGKWPEHDVDHRDRDRGNNAWTNLRSATRTQNNVNSVRPRKRKLPRGAQPYGGRYGSYIMVEGRRRWLGMFDTPEEASAAYHAAAQTAHGDYAPAAAA